GAVKEHRVPDGPVEACGRTHAAREVLTGLLVLALDAAHGFSPTLSMNPAFSPAYAFFAASADSGLPVASTGLTISSLRGAIIFANCGRSYIRSAPGTAWVNWSMESGVSTTFPQETSAVSTRAFMILSDSAAACSTT